MADLSSKDKVPMDEVRGTILLCDNLYPSTNGKWVIAGTYSNWYSVVDTLHMQSGFNTYIRIQVERAGTYSFRVLMINRDAPSNQPPLVQVDGKAGITDPNDPLEMGLSLPGMPLKCPIGPTETIPIGTPVVVNLGIWLEVNGKAIASTPLRIIFRNPKDPQHGQPATPSGQSPDHGGKQ